MQLADADSWADRARETLASYDGPLLRQVAGRLLRPRNRWPAAELVERCVAALSNPAAVDRRLGEAGVGARRLLGAIARSRLYRWRLGHLLAVAVALTDGDGPSALTELYGLGLILVEARPGDHRRSFETLLEPAGLANTFVFSPPGVAGRALGEPLGLPKVPPVAGPTEGHDADGLAWPLRLAVLWQRAGHNSFRRTQQGGFFKKDHDRLLNDPALAGESGLPSVETPDIPLLAAALAQAEGVLAVRDNELTAGALPEAWESGLAATVASLWAGLLGVERWDPEKGWAAGPGPNPYPAAYLLALLLLGQLPHSEWAAAEEVERWVMAHHPHWSGGPRPTKAPPKPPAALGPIARFLLGPAYELRLLQVAEVGGQAVLRLTALARWLLGYRDQPPAHAPPAKTLLVQPNLEVLVYRQGLTPSLIRSLSQFAAWKTIGAACTLHLGPESVYRGLELGWTYDRIGTVLEQHGTRPTPPSVTQSLRAWAQKHERISVYPEAALFEFARPEDMEEAFARGFEGVRITDRLAAVPNESAIDYRSFRLTATRDYSVPPGQCVTVGDDGITLAVDPARSDLLLETELTRFAESRNGHAPHGPGRYEVTPRSLALARERGLGETYLEEWFVRRTGTALPPAIRLLWHGRATPALLPRQELVLHLPSPEVGDGLLQWPPTQGLFRARLGPRALAVRPGAWEKLRQQLELLGLAIAAAAPAEHPH